MPAMLVILVEGTVAPALAAERDTGAFCAGAFRADVVFFAAFFGATFLVRFFAVFFAVLFAVFFADFLTVFFAVFFAVFFVDAFFFTIFFVDVFFRAGFVTRCCVFFFRDFFFCTFFFCAFFVGRVLRAISATVVVAVGCSNLVVDRNARIINRSIT
jgi:hypothetical protein